MDCFNVERFVFCCPSIEFLPPPPLPTTKQRRDGDKKGEEGGFVFYICRQTPNNPNDKQGGF
jgi:hypothetical protein